MIVNALCVDVDDLGISQLEAGQIKHKLPYLIDEETILNYVFLVYNLAWLSILNR